MMNQFKYLFIFFALCMFTNLDGIAQDTKVALVIDKDNIKIGEQLQVYIEVKTPTTNEITFPQLKDTITGTIEIVEIGKIDTNFTGRNLSEKVLSQKLLVTSFDTGFHTIPPVVFYTEKDSFRTDPLLLLVSNVEVEMSKATQQGEMEIKDIKDIREVSFSIIEWLKENWIWLLLAALLFVAIWAYFKYLHPKLKSKGPRVLIPKRIVPPHEIALGKLNALNDKKLWQTGKEKEFHSELTEIIRTYIEERFRVPALESTTSEILEDLEQLLLSTPVKDNLKNMLDLADLVKFAKYKPLPNDNEFCLKQAYTFVEVTKEVEETKEPITPANV